MIKNFIANWGLQLLVVGATTAVTLVVKDLYSKLTKFYEMQAAKQDAMAEGIKSVLYSTICDRCKSIKEREKITLEEVKDLDVLYKAYTELGGNGVAKKLYEECIELPTNYI